MVASENTKSSKFKSLNYFCESVAGYQLLPFKFLALDSSRSILTNNNGEFCVVPRDDVRKIVKKELLPESELYKTLKSKHFIIDADSSVAIDLLALKTRSRFERLSQFTGLHIFVATLRCDHSCPYCQVSRQSADREAFDMDWETAVRALEFTLKSPSTAIKIEFQGGEPLLNFELIRNLIPEAKQRAEALNKSVDFVIATNLSQLSDEIIEFCRTYDVYLSTSLDGPKDLHLANRPRPGNDSYDKTIFGIQKVREMLGADKVSALMTTTKASLPRVKEIVDEYVSRDFHEIFLRPLSPYGFAVKTRWFDAYDVEEWLQFYFEGLDYILSLNRKGIPIVESYASIILQKMFSPTPSGYVDLQSPAGIGIGAVVFNYDGAVYASDESRMLAEMNDFTFKLGDLKTDDYETMMSSEKLLGPLEDSITESSPMCSDCALEPFCGSDPVYHYATQRDFVGHKMASGFCSRNMAIIKRVVTLLEDDPEAREILLRWVRY